MRLLVISLLTILAGTLLHAKFKKEQVGKCFTWISWFFIVAGFILFIGFIGGGIYKMRHHGFAGQPNYKHEMMMKNWHHGMWGGRYCPQGMGKGMCSKNPGCMSHDSLMKCCPKHMKGDSIKMSMPKK